MNNTRFILALLLITMILSISHDANAQQNDPICTPVTYQPLASLPGLKDISGYTNRNFVRSYKMQIPTTSTTTQMSLMSNDFLAQTTYFDGLGKPIQTVKRFALGWGKDMVYNYVYDNDGVINYNYLPYSVVSINNDCGKFRSNPLTELKSLYDSKYPGQQPYAYVQDDNTSRARTVEEFQPGINYVGANRGKKTIERSNSYSVDNNIKMFFITSTGINDIPSVTGGGVGNNYVDNSLYVIEYEDEDAIKTIEYYDKQRKLLAVRNISMEDNSVSQTDRYKKMIITYYVYDELDRLRVVIPPEAYTQAFDVSTFSGFSQALLNGMCYRYWYDEKGRLSEEKLPGKDVQYSVYDKKNRLVLQQDGNLRANGNRWAYTVYDCLDRELFSGVELSGRSKQDWITLLQNGIYSSFSNAEIAYWLLKPMLYGEYPPLIFWDADVHVKNYYDGAAIPNFSYTYDFSYDGMLTGNTAFIASDAQNQTSRVYGLLTGKQVLVKHPGVNAWKMYTTQNFYNDYGLLIQEQKENHLGTENVITSQYDFAGDLVSKVFYHNDVHTYANQTTAQQDFHLVKSYVKNYNMGELFMIKQSINGEPEILLSHKVYDDFKRLSTEFFGTLKNTYEYDIRGRLTAINPDYVALGSQVSGVYFGETISYEEGFSDQYYNGNISGIVWRGAGTNAFKRFYGYNYDKLNRLEKADFGEETASCTWSKAIIDYSVSNITYDNNGNLLTMNQRGVDVTPTDMDILSYEYISNTNRLLTVSDAGVNNSPLPDFKDLSSATTEYTYDANGNVLTDLNRGISTPITYSVLNKPITIDVAGKGQVDYLYDGLGNRVQKKIFNQATGITTTYDYVGPLIFKDNTMIEAGNESGRTRLDMAWPAPPPCQGCPFSGVAPQPAKATYDYFIKDHLGNVRSVVSRAPTSMLGYFADHELAASSLENLVFDNIDNVRDYKPSSTDPNDQMAAELDGNDPNKTVGTAIMLRVMAGDKFGLRLSTYFEEYITTDDVVLGSELFNSLINVLSSGQLIDGAPVLESPDHINFINNALSNTTNQNIYSQLVNAANINPSVPSSHLNYLLFDEQMQLVQSNSGVMQFGSTAGQWNTIGTNTDVEVGQNGYLVVFMDNRSKVQVTYGDKLAIQFYKGELMEENHYYPFGLTLNSPPANLDDKSFVKFNTKELQTDEFVDMNGDVSGLELFDFGARMYDPQIGRWQNVDPLTSKYPQWSSYSAFANNPVKYIDPDGREPVKPYVGTASVFRVLLDYSPRKVGLFTGAQASDYLKSLGNTEFSWKQMRPLPTQTGFFNRKEGRYIYTEKGGWVDMAHFLFYAGKAYQYKLDGEENPIGEAVQDGYAQEFSDKFVAKHSAYSYEDLPSDKFGADFAVNYFDPESDLSFGEQLESYLNNILGATNPENAPNYNDLPAHDSSNPPTTTNETTTPFYTEDNR